MINFALHVSQGNYLQPAVVNIIKSSSNSIFQAVTSINQSCFSVLKQIKYFTITTSSWDSAVRCDLIGIKRWTTCNSSPKIPLHIRNLLASYTCSNLFTSVKVENVMTSCSSWPGAPWKAVLLSDFTSPKQLSKKVFKEGRISWNKRSPLSKAKLQGMAQDPLEVPEWCRKCNLAGRSPGKWCCTRELCHCIYSKAFSLPCYHKPDRNNTAMAKGLSSFMSAKIKESTWGLNPAPSKTTTFQLIHSSKAKINL